MKRLGALVVSILLVAGAWYVRDSLTDDGPESPQGSNSTTERPVLRCASELAAVCDTLTGVEVRTERPGRTADRLASGGKLDADAWLVAAPWLDVVAAAPGSTPLRRGPQLAATEVVAVGTADTADCRATWGCLAERAAGGLRIGHDDVDTAGGLLAVVGLVAGRLGNDRFDYATNDLQDDDGFGVWLRGVEDAVAPFGGAAITTIQTAKGTMDVAVGLATDDPSLQRGFDAAVPAPRLSVDVVLAGNTDGIDVRALRTALREAGWDDLAGTPRSPDGGVLATLRTRVKELQ